MLEAFVGYALFALLIYSLVVTPPPLASPAAVSVTLTRPPQQQTARCTTAGEARHGEGREALWPFESVPTAEGVPCWLQNSTHDFVYFLIRNSSYRAPFASLISELPVDTVHRMQQRHMSDDPHSPLSYFTSGKWNISQLRSGLFAPLMNKTDAFDVIASNASNSSTPQQIDDGDKVKLSIAKIAVDIIFLCARMLTTAAQRLCSHMLRVESLYYEKWTLSMPIRVVDWNATTIKLLSDAGQFLQVATFPPLVQIVPEATEPRLACPSIVEHYRLFNETSLVETHCLEFTRTALLSLLGRDTISEARLTAENEPFPFSPIDANAKYECTLYRRPAASPMCLSLSSESESGVEVTMVRELTTDWVFVGMLSAVVVLEVARRITLRKRTIHDVLELRHGASVIFEGVWKVGLCFFAAFSLKAICLLMAVLHFAVRIAFPLCWMLRKSTEIDELVWSLWDTVRDVMLVIQCVLIGFLYMSNPEAFVWVASYATVGTLLWWICAKATDDINDPEDDYSAYKKANHCLATANTVVMLRGNSAAARRKQYKDSGDYHTRKALEELAMTIRDDPWKYADLVKNPIHLLLFAAGKSKDC